MILIMIYMIEKAMRTLKFPEMMSLNLQKTLKLKAQIVKKILVFIKEEMLEKDKELNLTSKEQKKIKEEKIAEPKEQ